MGDNCEVKLEHLKPQSHVEVLVQCDYCGKIYKVKYQNYQNKFNNIEKDACTECKHLKAKESVQKSYDCDNVFQLTEVKQKTKKTCVEKYGVEHYSSSQEYKEKIKQTNLEKYGENSYTQTQEFKERVQKTNLIKYGVPYHTMLPEFIEYNKQIQIQRYGGIGSGSKQTKEKVQQATFKKHGYISLFMSPEFHQASRRKMFENNTAPTSKPQIELNERLKEIYGNSILNFPLGNCSLDCFVEINGIKIDVEYDGWYWHKNNQEHDNKRDWFVISKGFKVLRFIAHKKVPDKELIKKSIEELIQQDFPRKRIFLDVKIENT